ncbi:thioredoxin TrxC [Stakelama tenebrarum]|uniref:Thioredoxin n=1 Tax=Stakelama tenebrarum TaxID=2711215 RepID=A0A6G6Y285_9SPHN|nr:thioredoxin TrxC [Sphingosinithalassobacter tenebrarum]QIG79035.1 thioredoxin TrxC [Sphingosinithalassobacter tenebrarum]
MSDSEIIVCPHCATANRVPRTRLREKPTCGKCGAALFQGAPVTLDTAGFDRMMRLGTLPLLVDFWAEWCGPCRVMAPQFQAAAAALEPQVRLAKVDIEREQELAARYRIQSIPTVALFRAGREIARKSGALDRATLVQWTQATLR